MSSRAQETADAMNLLVDGDLSKAIAEAVPNITSAEADERARELAREYPPQAVLFWLEARRIRLSINALP